MTEGKGNRLEELLGELGLAGAGGGKHLDLEALCALAAESLEAEQHGQAQEHLQGCPECAARRAEIGALLAAPEPAAAPLSPAQISAEVERALAAAQARQSAAAPLPRSSRGRRWGWKLAALPVAAGLLLALGNLLFSRPAVAWTTTGAWVEQRGAGAPAEPRARELRLRLTAARPLHVYLLIARRLDGQVVTQLLFPVSRDARDADERYQSWPHNPLPPRPAVVELPPGDQEPLTFTSESALLLFLLARPVDRPASQEQLDAALETVRSRLTSTNFGDDGVLAGLRDSLRDDFDPVEWRRDG